MKSSVFFFFFYYTGNNTKVFRLGITSEGKEKGEEE